MKSTKKTEKSASNGRVISIVNSGQRVWAANHLRQLAVAVESGEANNVLIVFTEKDGAVGHLRTMIDEHERPYSLLGGIEFAKHRLLEKLNEE